MLSKLCKKLQVCATEDLFITSDDGWIYCAAGKAPARPLQVMQAAKLLRFLSLLLLPSQLQLALKAFLLF